jgi:DNA polymerase II large subunit
MPFSEETVGKKQKKTLETLAVPHNVVNNEFIIVKEDCARALFFTLGFENKEFDDIIEIISKKISEQAASKELDEESETKEDSQEKKELKSVTCDILSLLYDISGVKLKDKAGIFIGSRMARPEKAKHRKMTGSPHVLFPVGKEGGKLRSFQAALEKGFVSAQFKIFYCKSCDKSSALPVCVYCLKKCSPASFCSQCGFLSENESCGHDSSYTSKMMKLDMKKLFDFSLKTLGMKIFPDLIKGVRGTSNKEHYPEFLPKGFLRAKNSIYVNKDGTIRYDSSEVPITHFKPKEVSVSIENLKKLGYKKDIYSNELKDVGQILELKPQDIILPCCDVSPDDPADEVFFRAAKFVDEELVKIYNQKPYYNLKSKKDLIGHYVFTLAPHTSAATLGRIIGFSKTQGLFAHPMMHAAVRRDCDGDEAGFILLMDAFLNFSKKFLPSSRGSTQDAPLVLTYNINPSEVDDMYLHLDLAWKYPLSFYTAAVNYKMPWEVNIKQVADTLGSEDQYENLGFTHNTEDINQGVLCSAYKTLPSMDDKLKSQMDLAAKIAAVDTPKVAALVIEKHFIRDTKGNLRKFSMQQFRCVACNEKYRRPPLSGKCEACGGRIIFTISEGSIVKYLDKSLWLAEEYGVSTYLQQTLELLKRAVESIFGKEPEKQEVLGKWSA